MKTILLKTIIGVKRRVRSLAVKQGWIKKGDRLWYYYLPTDRLIDMETNKNKPQDIVQRGQKFGVKHKNVDILRRGFYDTKEVAQGFIDMEY